MAKEWNEEQTVALITSIYSSLPQPPPGVTLALSTSETPLSVSQSIVPPFQQEDPVALDSPFELPPTTDSPPPPPAEIDTEAEETESIPNINTITMDLDREQTTPDDPEVKPTEALSSSV